MSSKKVKEQMKTNSIKGEIENKNNTLDRNIERTKVK